MANMRNLSGVDIFGKRIGLLISPELCTGCRGCQTACKEWNKLPAEPTKNVGSYENPQDLSGVTWNRIRFIEPKGGPTRWLFSSQRCMHCKDAGCLQVCPVPGAIYRKENGTTGVNKKLCIGCKMCRGACVFDIPRFDKDDKISKCTLCEDRTDNGLAPLCAKTCPTGAIKYGVREELLKEAKAKGYKNIYGDGQVSTSVIFAFKNGPAEYGYTDDPSVPASVSFWRSFLKPLTVAGVAVATLGAAAHYITVGPQDDDEEGGDE